jgi:hypothetical protein
LRLRQNASQASDSVGILMWLQDSVPGGDKTFHVSVEEGIATATSPADTVGHGTFPDIKRKGLVPWLSMHGAVLPLPDAMSCLKPREEFTCS